MHDGYRLLAFNHIVGGPIKLPTYMQSQMTGRRRSNYHRHYWKSWCGECWAPLLGRRPWRWELPLGRSPPTNRRQKEKSRCYKSTWKGTWPVRARDCRLSKGESVRKGLTKCYSNWKEEEKLVKNRERCYRQGGAASAKALRWEGTWKMLRIERSQIWLVCREQRGNGMVWPERGRGQGYGTDYTKDIK